MNRHLLLVLSLLVLTLSGCAQLAYYQQLAQGQLDIWQAQQPIQSLLENPDTAEDLKQALRPVFEAKRFAVQQLHLPDSDSYSQYVALPRPYVVWSVYAAPRFQLRAKPWCFPLLGCISYRGYFKQADAQALADELAAQGYDVYVAGIGAYSTLGWFADPILSSMLGRGETALVSLLFHEIAHQKLYIANDTAFNESFANTVEYIGMDLWFEQKQQSAQAVEYAASLQRRKNFVALIQDYREKLDTLYQSPLNLSAMQAEKARLFQALRRAYQTLKNTQWHGYSGYDRWFAQDLNNAHLLTVLTYEDWVPAFQQLYIQQAESLPNFYQAVEQLGALPPEQRQQRLRHLIDIFK